MALADRASLEELCRTDFNMFCSLAAPDVCKFAFPPFFIAVFSIIRDAALATGEDLSKYAIGIPRAHAKTTFVKFLILWMIIFTKKRFFLILGKSGAKAEDILTDVVGFLESSNIIAIFGHWKSVAVKRDTLGEKRFVFRGRVITLAALGADGPVRGANKENVRPDFILMDDIQDENIAKSDKESNDLYEKILGTISLAGDPRLCQMVYLGNKYASHNCILTKLEKDPGWISLVVGAILEDGSPLWPELHSLKSLLNKLRSFELAGKIEIFFAELMNNVGQNNKLGFKYDRVQIFTPLIGESPIARWKIIDPSLGKAHSDDQVVGTFEAWSEKPHFTRVDVVQKSAPALVRQVLIDCVTEQCPIVFVEAVAYQESLIQWFEHYQQELGIYGLMICPISPGGRAKVARIKEGMKALEDGEMTIAQEVKSILFNEIQNYNPLISKPKDNIMDIAAYGAESLNKFRDTILAAQYLASDAAILASHKTERMVEGSFV